MDKWGLYFTDRMMESELLQWDHLTLSSWCDATCLMQRYHRWWYQRHQLTPLTPADSETLRDTPRQTPRHFMPLRDRLRDTPRHSMTRSETLRDSYMHTPWHTPWDTPCPDPDLAAKSFPTYQSICPELFARPMVGIVAGNNVTLLWILYTALYNMYATVIITDGYYLSI